MRSIGWDSYDVVQVVRRKEAKVRRCQAGQKCQSRVQWKQVQQQAGEQAIMLFISSRSLQLSPWREDLAAD